MKTEKIKLKNLKDTDKRIIAVLLIHKKKELGLQRHRISELLEKPRTTVYDSLVRLAILEVVESNSRKIHPTGRPGVFWSLTNYWKQKLSKGLRGKIITDLV